MFCDAALFFILILIAYIFGVKFVFFCIAFCVFTLAAVFDGVVFCLGKTVFTVLTVEPVLTWIFLPTQIGWY